MPWKHVNDLSKGMMTNRPASNIPMEASPYIKGCYIQDGEVYSDTGMVDYPVPSGTKSNQLLGTVMKIDTFRLYSGVSYLLAFTTRHLYQFNTTTGTWDVVTLGTLLENCEDAWVAAANVTATADSTIKIRGTNSSKLVIASGFTTGIVASESFVGIDISAAANTHLSFWMYSTATLASGVFRLRLSEQNTGATGATYADYTVPALTADTWTHCSVAIATPAASNGGTYPTDLDAVLSVALVAVSDPGAITVYIDDVRTAKEFTGDEDNRFSFTALSDQGVITNGVDAPTKVTDSSGIVHAALTLSLPTGAITTSEVVLALKDHILYMNNTENGADTPQRISWSNIGSISDMINGTAGFQDLTDDDSWIVGAAILSENEAAIYKERSIVQCVWVGGHTPFRFTTISNDMGAINKDCVFAVSGYHIVAAPHTVYAYRGDNDTPSFDDAIKKTLFNRIDGTYAGRSFLFYIKEKDEIQFFIPVSQTTADEGWTFGTVDKNWYIRDRNINCAGFYTSQTSLTIGDLIGTIGEQNYTIGSTLQKTLSPIVLVGDVNGRIYQLSESTLNNDGTAIRNEFQTPDFVLPDTPEFNNKFMRVNQLLYEASGQSCTTEWSSDGGLTWNPTQGGGTNVKTLTSIPTVHQQDFEANVKKIRFRWVNETASSGFRLKYYGFQWILRSNRA